MIFSRLCDFQSLYKNFSNTNNYQSIIEQIISKFPYYNSFWINLKIDNDIQNSVNINEFFLKFNTIIFDSDFVNINLFNFDFKSFNFNLYNEYLIKHLSIEYYFTRNSKNTLVSEKIERLIQEYFNEFIDLNSFLILNNKFYFILDIESSNFSQLNIENTRTISDLRNKVILYVNLNTNTNDYMNLLIKIGKTVNFSKYNSNFDNDKVFKSLIILKSKEVIEKLTFKFNNEVKIFCFEYFQNKINRHIFNPQISSIFNNNSFYELLDNHNSGFINFHQKQYKLIQSNINNFFKNKSHIFVNFLFGQKQVGKTFLMRYLANDHSIRKINKNLLEEESDVKFRFKEATKFNYLNLNFLGLNIKVFKKYIKSFFYNKDEDAKLIYIIDGLSCLSSNKNNENGNSQKEVNNYLAFKILMFIKAIQKKNKSQGNKIFIIFLLNSVTDIPDIFRNSSNY